MSWTMNEDGVFKLEKGQKEYENIYHAMTVAEAKAADEDEPVTIYKKLLNTFEPVVKILPDGSQKQLSDE